MKKRNLIFIYSLILILLISVNFVFAQTIEIIKYGNDNTCAPCRTQTSILNQLGSELKAKGITDVVIKYVHVNNPTYPIPQTVIMYNGQVLKTFSPGVVSIDQINTAINEIRGKIKPPEPPKPITPVKPVSTFPCEPNIPGPMVPVGKPAPETTPAEETINRCGDAKNKEEPNTIYKTKQVQDYCDKKTNICYYKEEIVGTEDCTAKNQICRNGKCIEKIEICVPPTTTPPKDIPCDKESQDAIGNQFKKPAGTKVCGTWLVKESGKVTGEIKCGECPSCYQCIGLDNKPVSSSESPGFCAYKNNPMFSGTSGTSGSTSTTSTTPEVCPPTSSNLETKFNNANVKIKISDSTGADTGSGTIINIKDGKALIATCGHIFRDSAGKGDIKIDLSSTSGEETIQGNLIAYDLKKDIGLIWITLPQNAQVEVVSVAPDGTFIKKDDEVYTAGCSRGAPCTVVKSKVSSTNKYLGPNNVQVTPPPVGGRSGGGLFNCKGQLIGICSAADPTSNEGLYMTAGELRDFLKQNNLDYAIPQAHQQPSPQTPSSTSPAGTLFSQGLFAAEQTILVPITNSDCKKTATSIANDGCCNNGKCGECKQPAKQCNCPQNREESCKGNIKSIEDAKKEAEDKCKGPSPPGSQTANFIVRASNPYLACVYGQILEYWRERNAIETVGQKFPDWGKPAVVTIQTGSSLGNGGATTFLFDRGEAVGWIMSIQGSYNTLIDSVIPHEVQHMVVASYFRKSVPRWADEGFSSNTESQKELCKHFTMNIQFLKTGRGISLNNLFAMKEYPRDVMPLYAQGTSLTEYLLKQGGGGCEGKKKFIKFLSDGLKTGDWANAVKNNYGFNSLGDLQNQWLKDIKDNQLGSVESVKGCTPCNCLDENGKSYYTIKT